MNSLLLPFSLLLLLFSAFSTPPPPAAVIDADGHQLQAGAKYYIIPALQSTGGGGGLALSAKDIPCPFYVMQENMESSVGLPARFLPADTKLQKEEGVEIITVVTVSNDVNVVFNAATICVQSTVWKVGDFDRKTGRRYVMSNGVIGFSNNNTGAGAGAGEGVRSLFKIEKPTAARGVGGGGNAYKIVYCPSGSGKVLCGDLGVFSENGKRWIGLNDDDPLLVFFKKA